MSKTIKILFLAANPKDTPRVRLDEEIRGIKEALLRSEFRDKFDIAQEWAVRVSDLQSYLLQHKPDIVHFSGHGSKDNTGNSQPDPVRAISFSKHGNELSEIILENNAGNSQPVSTRALSQLFSVLKDNIRCVVLNACYTEPQAQAIAQHIDCVIGMSKAIGDAAAISFAVAFYQALGFGRDVKTAFDLGCVQVDLQSLGEQDTPKLLAVKSKPEEIAFGPELKGPLGNRKFNDDRVNSVLGKLRKIHQEHNSDMLPMQYLLPELDSLFDRKTFRHEFVKMCTNQLWGERLHTAYQTFAVLQAYQRNVKDEGTSKQYSLYQKLLAAVSGYCMNMGVYLFESTVDEIGLEDYIGTPEFKTRLPKERKFEIGTDGLIMDDKTSRYCDGKRESAIKLMDQLTATVKR